MKTYVFKNNPEKKVPIGKIICLARTYKQHAEEMKTKQPETPLLFLKPSTAVIFSGESIIFPSVSNCLHHEVELGIVIGTTGKNIPQKNALDHVIGYLVGLDITARDIQTEAKKNGWPWTVAKGFDTFAPISDVVGKNLLPNPNDAELMLKVNGEIRQHSRTSQMIFPIEKIIAFISSIMTLEPGDLILTGTPEGVGEIARGDILEGLLEDVCSVTVDVR